MSTIVLFSPLTHRAAFPPPLLMRKNGWRKGIKISHKWRTLFIALTLHRQRPMIRTPLSPLSRIIHYAQRRKCTRCYRAPLDRLHLVLMTSLALFSSGRLSQKHSFVRSRSSSTPATRLVLSLSCGAVQTSFRYQRKQVRSMSATPFARSPSRAY